MKPEQAEVIALQAITFISSDEHALHGLLAQSGAGIDDLREKITDPIFLAGILDFLLSDEAALIAFCEEIDLRPELLVSARRALPGGDTLWDG